MGSTNNGAPLPAASEAPLPPDNSPAMPSGSDIAKQSAASAITSKLGSLGGFGFGHKKKDADTTQNSNSNGDAGGASNGANGNNGQQSQAAAILMEMQITSSDFSNSPVDEARFTVPQGFRQVDPQMH